MFYEKGRRGSEKNIKTPKSMTMRNQSENSLRSPFTSAFWKKCFLSLAPSLYQPDKDLGAIRSCTKGIHMLNWNSCFLNQRKNEVKQGPPTWSGNNVLWVKFLLWLFLLQWLTRSLREDGSPWAYPKRVCLQSILIFPDTKLRLRLLYMVDLMTHWWMSTSGVLQNSSKLTRLWNGLS